MALVTWFDDDTPSFHTRPPTGHPGQRRRLRRRRIVGTGRCGWGGSVHSIPFMHQTSTTALLITEGKIGAFPPRQAALWRKA